MHRGLENFFNVFAHFAFFLAMAKYRFRKGKGCAIMIRAISVQLLSKGADIFEAKEDSAAGGAVRAAGGLRPDARGGGVPNVAGHPRVSAGGVRAGGEEAARDKGLGFGDGGADRRGRQVAKRMGEKPSRIIEA